MALSVLFNDWISELSDDILSWLLLLFNGADCIVLIWLFDGFDCSWRFVNLFAEPRLMPQWLLSIFGHFGWWHRIFWGENRLSGVRGRRPSLRCWYWYLNRAEVEEGWEINCNGERQERYRVSFCKHCWNRILLGAGICLHITSCGYLWISNGICLFYYCLNPTNGKPHKPHNDQTLKLMLTKTHPLQHDATCQHIPITWISQIFQQCDGFLFEGFFEINDQEEK